MISHSRSVGSRYRKQRFPRPDRRRTVAAFDASCVDDDYDSGDENCYSLTKRPREHDSPNLPMNRSVKQGLKSIETKTAAVQSFSRVDKRARDEHNEQERSRRRELAVIYELIRCSLVPEDLKRLDHGSQAKSISKLSYPQVLQIAYHVVKEEQHHLLLLEQTINDIKRLEKELARAGLHVPPRPPYPSITDCYKKVVTVVDEVLRHDKSARTPNGVYDMTPAQRAAQGDEELVRLQAPRYNFSSCDPLSYSSLSIHRHFFMSNQHGSSPYPHQTQSNFSSIHHQPQAGSFHSIANSRSLPVNTSLMAYPLSRSQPASSGGTRELVDSGCDGQGAINCLPVTQPRRSSVHSGRHIYYTMHPYLRHQPSLLPNGCVSSNSDLTRRHEQQHRLYSLSGESIVVRRLHSTSSSSSVTSVGLPNLDSVGAQNCLGAGGDCSSAGSIDDGTDFDDLGPMACPESCYASEPLPSSSYSDFDDGGLKCEVRLVDCRNGINEGYSHSNFDYMGKSIVLHQSSSLRRSVPPPIYLDGARAPVRISVGDPSDEPASAVTIKSSPSHDFIIRSE